MQSLVQIPKLRISWCLKFSVLLGLSVYMTLIVYHGPLCSLLRNSTVIRKNELNTEDSNQPLVRPSFSVCKYPFYKNPAKYEEFLQRNFQNDFDNETEFNALVDEVFYNKPEDFFHGFNIAPTYEEVVNNTVRIPVTDPYVRIVLVDYLYNGFCAMISYEALNQFMVEQGEVSANEKDFSFSNVFFLNGQNMPKGGFFIFKYIMKDEDIFAGVETITNSFMGEIGSGLLRIYLMSFDLVKNLRNCKMEPAITPCVTKYYNEMYGNSYKSSFNKTKDLVLTTFDGGKTLVRKTGCMMPCELTKYQVQEYRKYEVEYLTDPMLKNQLKEFNDSKASLILINHQKAETILQHEEVLEYDAYKFISDSGGTVGIFVGISFWSLYVDIVGPLFEWLEKKFLHVLSFDVKKIDLY